MSTDTLAVVNTIIGGLNFVAIVTIAFWGGRWIGRVDVRLDVLEKNRG